LSACYLSAHLRFDAYSDSNVPGLARQKVQESI